MIPTNINDEPNNNAELSPYIDDKIPASGKVIVIESLKRALVRPVTCPNVSLDTTLWRNVQTAITKLEVKKPSKHDERIIENKFLEINGKTPAKNMAKEQKIEKLERLYRGSNFTVYRPASIAEHADGIIIKGESMLLVMLCLLIKIIK